jgi:putative oxidoreductase
VDKFKVVTALTFTSETQAYPECRAARRFCLLLHCKILKSMKKLLSTKYSDTSFTIAALLLRLGFGGLMVHHGYEKLVGFASRSHSFSDPLHIGSLPSLVLVIFAEFFCAIFIVIGLFTRLACIPLIITMAVATFISNHGQITGNGEEAMLFLAGYLAILFIGPGKVSLDKLSGK